MALSFIFKADGSQYTRGLEKMRSQTASWSGGISKMIVGAFAAGAVVASIRKIISASSDLTETISKTRTVFGDSSKAIEDWADTLASRMGQSKASALEAVSGFASMFDVLGVGKKRSEQMSKTLVELASDMASFHNTSVEQALRAIGSGLRGEMEPLRKFNVLLNEATLKQEAYSMGLFDGKGNLDLAARSQAAYGLILEQSEVAIGDFERTSGDLANSLRIMKAEVTNLSASLGNDLVPAALTALTALNKLMEGVKIWRGLDDVSLQIEAGKKTDDELRQGGVTRFKKDNLDAGFTEHEIKILRDMRSSTEELDSVMRNHGFTINDLHKSTVDFMRSKEEEADLAAENAASAKSQADEQIKSEKDLAKAQEDRIKRLVRLKELLAKSEFDALGDSEKKTKLEDEKAKLEKTVEFEETHKAQPGEEDVADEIKIKAKLRLLEIEKELTKLREKFVARRESEADIITKEEEKQRKIQEKINAPFKDLAQAETTVIASSLAQIGGGGGVASFTSDPMLAATIESKKILERIEKNTQPNIAAPTIPEI